MALAAPPLALRLRARTHKIASGGSDLINVCLGPLSGFKSDMSRRPRKAGTLKLNVPVSAARLVLPNGCYFCHWPAHFSSH
jgi:hypothetical protein